MMHYFTHLTLFISLTVLLGQFKLQGQFKAHRESEIQGQSELQAKSVLGKWITYDIFNSSVEEAVVEIYTRNKLLYIRIDSIIPEEHRGDRCSRCEGDLRDEPIKGMEILRGARLEEGLWQGAKILNAKNGRWYGCQITPTATNKLKVRGFIGYPLFGKNLFWKRLEEKSGFP